MPPARTLVLIAVVAAAGSAGAAAQDVVIRGKACVVDGATLVLGETNDVGRCRVGHGVRLYGLDAPELEQSCERGGRRWACGAEAMRALRSIVEGRQLECRGQGERWRGREFVQCFLGATDVGQRLVRDGWAVADRRRSTRYVGDETLARSNRLGIWSGSFVEPDRWRRGER